MAIKNKDGSVFRLSCPNPLTAGQEQWDRDIVLHNLGWEEEIVDDTTEVNVIQPKPELKLPEKIVEEPEDRTKLHNILIMHCQPAKITQKKDDLYREVYTRVDYGDKLLFEAVVVNLDDLAIQFWTTYPITSGSIVYPSKYKDGRAYGDHRWWKITKTIDYQNGFLAEGIMSQDHPDFS
jgi:hypothetical protein